MTHHTFHGADRFRLDDQRWFNRFFVRHQTSWWANTSKDGTDPVIRSVALDRQGLLFHTLHDVPLDAFKSTSQSGKAGAKYFRGRKAVEMVYLEQGYNRSTAASREAAIKKLSRAEKLALIAK